jgi:hypothetical protein
MTRLILVLSAIALLPCLMPAKRVAPPRVDPVIHDGIRYVAPNDDGRRAYIATSGTSVPKFHGDALLVSKSETASALIYWNDKRYTWFQQGD